MQALPWISSDMRILLRFLPILIVELGFREVLNAISEDLKQLEIAIETIKE